MSKIEKCYNNCKDDNKDILVIVKSGIFYYSYNDDAILLWYLFEYKIKDNELGFSSNSYSKVISNLKFKHISFIVYDLDCNVLDEYSNKDDFYSSYSKAASIKHLEKEKINDLINKINLLLEISNDNYDKINNYLDSLF